MAWWDAFTKDGEPHEGRVDLYDLEVEEVSFVDAGDNPGAHVLLYKRHDAVGRRAAALLQMSGVRPSADVSAEALQEIALHVAKQSMSSETNGGTMTTQFTKTADVTAAVQKQAEERVAAADGLTIAQARVEVWLENPHLQERYQQLRVAEAEQVADTMKRANPGMMAAPTDEVAKAQAGVLQKHRAAMGELRKLYPHASAAELRNMAWQENPELYEEYRRAG